MFMNNNKDDFRLLIELMANDPKNPKYVKKFKEAWYDRMCEALFNLRSK